MKKILFVFMVIGFVLSLLSCQGQNRASEIIVSSYQQMEHTETVQESIHSEGEMLGDAYYVIGTKNELIHVVHHYMGEYISLTIDFDDQTSDSSIEIKEIRIEYCDYEKDIYLTSYATTLENSLINEDVGYQTLFNLVENLSIQELRNILKAVDLL